MGLIAYSLIVNKYPFLNDFPLSTFYAFIVVTNGTERSYLRFISDYVNELAAVIEFFRLPFIKCQEAGAGKICFIAKNTIQFGRMACRLMNRQPKVGGIENEIIFTGLN